MDSQMWDLLKTIIVALLSSGAVTTVITRYLDKHSKVGALEGQINEMSKVINRQADAIEALLKSNMELLHILHEKQIINGESAHLRDEFSQYMYDSQAHSLHLREKKK